MGLENIGERIQSEIESLFPAVDKQHLQWKRLKTLKRHVLVIVTRYLGDSVPADSRFLALDAFGKCLSLGGTLQTGSATEGLLVLLREEKLEVREKNSGEIVELFGLMHPQKKILEDVNDLIKWARGGKKDRVEKIANVIQPPSFKAKGEAGIITFWTIDFWTGDLEQWDILEDSQGETRIEKMVLETNLIPVLL
jgi:hypothetical protein